MHNFGRPKFRPNYPFNINSPPKKRPNLWLFLIFMVVTF